MKKDLIIDEFMEFAEIYGKRESIQLDRENSIIGNFTYPRHILKTQIDLSILDNITENNKLENFNKIIYDILVTSYKECCREGNLNNHE